MAQRCTTAEHVKNLGIIIVALALGLRLGEASAITPEDILIAGQLGIKIHCEKQAPGKPQTAIRHPTKYTMAWALYLRRLGLITPHSPLTSRTQVADTLTYLLGDTSDNKTFHSIRRAAAKYLWDLGHPLEHSMDWCRWSSGIQARFYIGEHNTSHAAHCPVLLPLAPTTTEGSEPLYLAPGDSTWFWHTPPTGSSVTHTGEKRRRQDRKC